MTVLIFQSYFFNYKIDMEYVLDVVIYNLMTEISFKTCHITILWIKYLLERSKLLSLKQGDQFYKIIKNRN
jgi:hypothetical protein